MLFKDGGAGGIRFTLQTREVHLRDYPEANFILSGEKLETFKTQIATLTTFSPHSTLNS